VSKRIKYFKKGEYLLMKKNVLFIFCFGVLVMATAANAQTFKWVDDHGVVHLSDSPPSQGTSALVEIASPANFKSKPSSDLPSAQNITNPQGASGSPVAAEERAEPRNITVELYTTSWCPYCKDARNFFRSRGISFTEYDIEKDEEAARRKNSLDGGRGVPFAVICDQKIRGFSTIAYENALATCGQ
jgi:glutaredoxin